MTLNQIIISLILGLSLMTTIIKSVPMDPTIYIEGTIFDQWPEYNYNFEKTTPGSSVKTLGMVTPNLNPITKVPELSSYDNKTKPNTLGTMQYPELFQYHFTSNVDAPTSKNSGKNLPMRIQFKLDQDSSGFYTFFNQTFFPIDNIGYDVDPSFRIYKQSGNYHNFHFCVKMNSRFTYNGGEVFNFKGDDDLWVYINDKLVVDVGGIHPAQDGSVNLDTLGLTKNKVYPLDLFYCERHTDGSTISIQTTIQAYCAWYDYCGVCGGTGAVCCNAKANCDDGDLCTIDSCPQPNLAFPDLQSVYKNCSHIPKDCPPANKCQVNSCDKTTGNCKPEKLTCPDRSDECLKNTGCDDLTGCKYASICTDSCDKKGNVCVAGKCQKKTNSDCAAELDDNSCKVYSCNSTRGGCFSENKCKPDPTQICDVASCDDGVCSIKTLPPNECNCGCNPNFCQKSNCVKNPSNNQFECSILPADGIDDGNACTENICDPVAQKITHVPYDTCKGCMSCNPSSGACEAHNEVCNDFNACTENVCSPVQVGGGVGECVTTNTTCVPTTNVDKCKNYLCDSEKGCYQTDVVCPDSGNCKVGYCDSKVGCSLKPRVCKSPAFCIVAECDETVGCIAFERRCASSNPKCKAGICVNGTTPEEGECESVNYDPKPFICQTGAIVSTAVIAGVTVAGAVALGIFIYGGKRGYDYWKESRSISMSSAVSSPMYVPSANASENPLYIPEGEL
ncbi:hypothetical protein ACTFIY_003151 [Dictyostelium cf. discoideum]